MKELNLLTPFTEVNIRSKPIAAGTKLLTGRWVALNSSGQAVLPGAGATGVYLLVEGSYTTDDALVAGDYAGSNPYLPTDQTRMHGLPSAIAALQVAVAYGIFVFSVLPVGFVISSANPGDSLKVDDGGRLVPWISGTDADKQRVAVVESFSTNLLVARTLGN